MKIAVIGSGAIGCLFGAELSKKHDVYMICRRQAVADAIDKDGLIVYDVNDVKHVYDNVQAYVSGQCDTKMDLVIVIVKAMDTETSMAANMGMIGDETLVMTLQNGGGNDTKLEKFVPVDRVIIGTTKNNCINLGNGTIRHRTPGMTVIGTDSDTIDVEAVARVFIECGLEMEVSENIHYLMWSKLFINLTTNSFTAIVTYSHHFRFA